jgi:Putative zinc-finger
MDCRETQTLLPAFHDGELPAADRVRVEDHLRGCAECGALLADLERADQAAGVPDPGPAYWDRFNARVMDRVGREADGPEVTVLRPKGGWMRQQLRYLVPAAAVAALVVVVVRYGGMHPGVPVPGVPPAVSEPAAPVPVEQRRTDSAPVSRAAKKAESAEVARRVPPPAVARERPATGAREERDRPAATADSAPATVPDGTSPKMRSERKNATGATAPTAEQQAAATGTSAAGMRIAKEAAPDGHGWPGAGTGRDAPGSVVPAGSPCEMARTLAGRERFREAEDAQRACLAGKLPEPAMEKGLVFLAELLDRQARFADADAVIAEVDRRFPQSRPLDLYRQQRPMVQKRPMAVPVTR